MIIYTVTGTAKFNHFRTTHKIKSTVLKHRACRVIVMIFICCHILTNCKHKKNVFFFNLVPFALNSSSQTLQIKFDFTYDSSRFSLADVRLLYLHHD